MLTLFTAKSGKLRVLAKGARRPSSRLVGHTEPFSIITGQINLQSKIPILSQVTVEHTISGLEDDPQLVQKLSLVAEIIDKALEEGIASEAAYAVFIEGMLRLRSQYQPMLFLGLVVRLLGLLGYAPEISHCVVCKLRLEAGGKFGWNHNAGGIVADNCLIVSGIKTEPITNETLKALRFLQRQPLTMMERLQAPEAVATHIHDLVIDYTRYVLEQPLISAKVVY